ncbi:MAG TPA: hypothetical protein VGK75_01190 [Casimicrobiaceae bacterium]
MVFGINEGVTYRISASEVRERYREIADDLTKILKRPVRIEYMDEYVLNLEMTDEGQRRLNKLGYKGFATYDENVLIALGRWLEPER